MNDRHHDLEGVVNLEQANDNYRIMNKRTSACHRFQFLIDSFPPIFYMAIIGSILMYKLCTINENEEENYKTEECKLSYNDYVTEIL